MTRFTLAAAQYPIDRLDGWQAYADKLTAWVEAAARGGARLALFPEYGAMELAALDSGRMGDLEGSLVTVAARLSDLCVLFEGLSKQHEMYLLAPSIPVLTSAGYVNRAHLFAPSGKVGIQDKLVMTRFEREEWFVSASGPLRLFETSLGKIGVNICYDSEFPLLARAQVEAGMELLLVPSCTDSLHGYWRVRLGTQARALEGQCYAVQSPTVGNAEWNPAVDVNCGAAGVFAPPDRGMPASGVVALGEMDKAQWLFAEVDLAKVAELRASGGVLNARHWAEQPGAQPLPPVELVDLR
ncbi:carbon-nitrogen hydrolase family protein [Novosphingobium sp.]|uniref:carbon-nitrogen hydrolase family protein n=1 Tax=Novosphingobium sp. TaxID=1874826 RepID=UPI0025F2B826|nr:carbon-nitrogen hydrolase family protein [Novosphingobium sp.]MCC6925365.1 carbon-nitrogen hydrolase family protein [Novosphingobium sp.]